MQPIILTEFRRIVQKSKSRDYRTFLYKVVTLNIEYYSILRTIEHFSISGTLEREARSSGGSDRKVRVRVG